MSGKSYKVVVRRRNGRFMRATQPMSAYAAKKKAEAWTEKYDLSFQIEIVPASDSEKKTERIKT